MSKHELQNLLIIAESEGAIAAELATRNREDWQTNVSLKLRSQCAGERATTAAHYGRLYLERG